MLRMMTLLIVSALWLQAAAAQPVATIKIFGAVSKPTAFTAADLAAMPRVELTATAHNQTEKYRLPLACGYSGDRGSWR